MESPKYDHSVMAAVRLNACRRRPAQAARRWPSLPDNSWLPFRQIATNSRSVQGSGYYRDDTRVRRSVFRELSASYFLKCQPASQLHDIRMGCAIHPGLLSLQPLTSSHRPPWFDRFPASQFSVRLGLSLNCWAHPLPLAT